MVECDSNNGLRSWLEVTSGCITAKKIFWSGGSGTRGYFREPAVRVLAQKLVSTKKAAYLDGAVEFRFWVDQWHSDAPSYQGATAFIRYRGEDTTYTASVRRSGAVVIQRKTGSVETGYTRLKEATIPPLQPGRWYTLKFAAKGSTLSFYVNGALVASATDSRIKAGTSGARFDYFSGFIDDWKMMNP